MKDFQRSALLAGIVATLFLLVLQWNKFQTTHPDTLQQNEPAKQTAESNTKNDLPSAQAQTEPSHTLPSTLNTAQQQTNKIISIKTDTLEFNIDPNGGDIVGVSLPQYPSTLSDISQATSLLQKNNERIYIAQSGLIGPDGTDSETGRPLFVSANQTYRMEDGANELVVDLNTTQKGINITKRFHFHRGEYLVDVDYLVENQSEHVWRASFFGQIKRNDFLPGSKSSGLNPFLGIATTTSDAHYKKQGFKDIEKNPLNFSLTGGWIAFVQHYFISAWIAPGNDQNTFTSRKLGGQNIYIVGYTGAEKTIAPGQSGIISSRFYAGPKITQRLEQIAPYLDLTVDYGWLWWVAKPIHYVLQFIHSAISNWGWSIVALTVVIKIVLLPLSQKGYVSMAAMRKVTPKMTALREQYGDNRQKLQEEMLKLYKTEKINPLGGCLPMLIQMPVFISLYWVLQESVEIRQAPFVFWIKDLSVMDPFFVLPILMGASMYFQQKMNPPPPDPMQAKVMQFLPVIFTFMFLWFPAGLVLYWLVNNITSMIHQGIINKQQDT